MSGRTLRTVLFVVTVLSGQSARSQEHNFSIALNGHLTTASRLFTNPNSTDAFLRSQYFALEDFPGYGLEIRYQFPETNIAVGLSGDYIQTTVSRSERISTSPSIPLIPVEDGYRVIPVELTGYFIIPVSSQSFGVFMGGGIGGYFGSRIFKRADADAPTTDVGHGFGIHVLGGLSYRFTEWFSLKAEMKFRDLQFQTTNKFSVPATIYKGTVVTLDREELHARVHTEGVVFQFGTVFHF